MKPERRTLILGAVAIGALAALSAREARRSTCASRPCCPPLPGLVTFSTNVWAPVPSTNQPPVPTPAQPVTNRPQ